MAENNPLAVLPQNAADGIAASFLNEFYGSLTSKGTENHKSFYARNATVKFPEGDVGLDQLQTKYEKLGLDQAFIDISKGFVEVTPTLAQGLKLTVKGLLKREIEETEVHCNFTHNFLLMPVKSNQNTTYFVLNEKLSLGKETKVQEEAPKPSKPAEKKPTQSRAAPTRPRPAAPAQNQTQQQPKTAPEVKPSSYASALAAQRNTSEEVQKPLIQTAATQGFKTNTRKPTTTTKKTPVNENSVVAKRLPDDATEEDLRTLCSEKGKVVSVELLKSGRAAFIEFDSPETVSKLIDVDVKLRKLEGKVNGKEYSVSLWKKDERPPGPPNRRHGQHGGRQQ